MKKYLSALLLSGAFFSATSSASTEPVCQDANPTTCELGQLAEKNFFDAWADGDWSQFRQMLAKDNVIFQFPAGPYQGRSFGKDGYDKINGWIEHNIEFNNRIHHSERNQRFAVGGWYYFADVAQGTFYGNPYVGSHFIGFRFADGKIVEYREYVGDLTHWK